MYIVNWYPGSYGDRIIADLFNMPYTISNNDIYSLPYNNLLKFPETYSLDLNEFDLKITKHILPDLKKYQVVGAHRFNGLDFTKIISGCRVISIDPGSNLNLVSDLYFKKVFGRRSEYDNDLIKKLVRKNLIEYAKRYQIKLIDSWKKDNILQTDLIFSLEKYIEDNNYINWFKYNVMS